MKNIAYKYSLLWLVFSLIRIANVCAFYLRLDPYGVPPAARIDRMLPFASLVEVGAVALLLSVFMLAGSFGKEWLRKFMFRSAAAAGSAYLVIGVIDYELQRYLGIRISWSIIKTYVKPGNLFDGTVVSSTSGDSSGFYLAIGLGVASILTGAVTIWLSRRAVYTGRAVIWDNIGVFTLALVLSPEIDQAFIYFQF